MGLNFADGVGGIHQEIFRFDANSLQPGVTAETSPLRFITSMSLTPVIDWRVGLHQPRTIPEEKRLFE
jgi:hypothetical protein